MDSIKINQENFAVELTKALKTYSSEINELLETEKAKTAGEIVTELQTSNAWKDRSTKKSYRKGFSVAREIIKWNAKLIIHNRNKPQIVHLLEKGHVGRDGKRVEARPHMGPVSEKHLKKLEQTIEQAIRNGV